MQNSKNCIFISAIAPNNIQSQKSIFLVHADLNADTQFMASRLKQIGRAYKNLNSAFTFFQSISDIINLAI